MANTMSMLLTDEEGFERNLQWAIEWHSTHPGRDALDVATAAVMRDGHVSAHGCGTKDWPRFLEAVREAIAP